MGHPLDAVPRGARYRAASLWRGLRIVGLASAIGIVAAAGAARLLQDQLYGVPALDLTTFVLVPALLAAVAAVACWLPARRASRVDPVIALQTE